MKPKPYDQVAPIEPRPCCLWLVDIPEADTKKLVAVATDMPLEEVYNFIKGMPSMQIYKHEFFIKAIDVGDFHVEAQIYSYSSDGREVDQDMNVVLRTKTPERRLQDYFTQEDLTGRDIEKARKKVRTRLRKKGRRRIRRTRK